MLGGDRIALASYIANRLYDAGILGDNTANMIFDQLVYVFERLPESAIHDISSDVTTHHMREKDNE
jgi:hypothetical protein